MRVGREIDEPGFRNAGAGVEWHFHVAIIGHGTVRDFDDKQYVSRAGVLRGAPGTESEYGHVWLRDVVLVEHNRVLDIDHRFVLQGAGKQMNELPDAAGVAVADRGHFDDLAVDELDPIVFPEDPQLDELLVGVHRVGTFEEWNSHMHNIASAKKPSQSYLGMG